MENELNNVEQLKNISEYLNQYTTNNQDGLRFEERIPRVIAGSDEEYTGSTCFYGYIVETTVLNKELRIKVKGWDKNIEHSDEIREYSFTYDKKGIYEQYQYTISELRDNSKGNRCESDNHQFEILIKGGRAFNIYF